MYQHGMYWLLLAWTCRAFGYWVIMLAARGSFDSSYSAIGKALVSVVAACWALAADNELFWEGLGFGVVKQLRRPPLRCGEPLTIEPLYIVELVF